MTDEEARHLLRLAGRLAEACSGIERVPAHELSERLVGVSIARNRYDDAIVAQMEGRLIVGG